MALNIISCTEVLAQKKSVATFSRVVGNITIINDDKPQREVRRNQVVFTGDTIKTGPMGWATINFFDLTRVVLRPNSEFIIEKFPQAVDGGRVQLVLNNGAIRITTGTLSNSAADNFVLETPLGAIGSSRAEWVLQLCEGDECNELQQDIKYCGQFDNKDTKQQQWVSVYKGSVSLPYCELERSVTTGMSSIYSYQNPSCEFVNYIPCFILADKALGRDKLRRFLPLLDSLKIKRHDEKIIDRPRRPDARPRRNRPLPPPPRRR